MATQHFDPSIQLHLFLFVQPLIDLFVLVNDLFHLLEKVHPLDFTYWARIWNFAALASSAHGLLTPSLLILSILPVTGSKVSCLLMTRLVS